MRLTFHTVRAAFLPALAAIALCSLFTTRSLAQTGQCANSLTQQEQGCYSTDGSCSGSVIVYNLVEQIPAGNTYYNTQVGCCYNWFSTWVFSQSGCQVIAGPQAHASGDGFALARAAASDGTPRPPTDLPQRWQPVYMRDCHGGYDLLYESASP